MKNIDLSAKPFQVTRYKTTNYSIFSFISGNRPTEFNGQLRKDQRKCMETFGWFDFVPALVIMHLNKLLVVDGQHRVVIAEELKIPVVYEIINMTINQVMEIISFLQIGKPWSIPNHINKWAVEGDPDYVYLRTYAKENGISESQAANLLIGQLPSGHNTNDNIKNGVFKVKNVNYANRVLEVFNLFSDFKEIQSHANLLLACAKLTHVKEFDKLRLKRKLGTHPQMVRNAHSCSDFLQMIEDIYNRQSTDKTPLKFHAEKITAERSVSFGKQ